MTYKAFAEYIKKTRIEKNITQTEAAFWLTISKSRYCRIENGIMEPTFLELQRICILLSIDLTELLELKKRPAPYHVYFD